jgi:hypothetical protein
MYMAGAVGSHRLDSVKGESFDRIRAAGEELSSLVMNYKETAPLEGNPTFPLKISP